MCSSDLDRIPVATSWSVCLFPRAPSSVSGPGHAALTEASRRKERPRKATFVFDSHRGLLAPLAHSGARGQRSRRATRRGVLGGRNQVSVSAVGLLKTFEPPHGVETEDAHPVTAGVSPDPSGSSAFAPAHSSARIRRCSCINQASAMATWGRAYRSNTRRTASSSISRFTGFWTKSSPESSTPWCTTTCSV